MKASKKKYGAIALCLVIGLVATMSTTWQDNLFDRTVIGGPMVVLLVSMIACNLIQQLQNGFCTGWNNMVVLSTFFPGIYLYF